MRLNLKRIKALQREERDLVGRVLTLLRRQDRAVSQPYEREVKAQLDRLDLLARSMRQAPSIYGEQRIGSRRRDLASLIDSLAHSSAFNFELHMPLRALIGRTLLMAKVSFFRMVRHLLSDAGGSEAARRLSARLERHLCTCIYTKIAEEILTALAADTDVDQTSRRKAVVMLCQIWEHRLTYHLVDFFPVLESVWEARRQAKVTFGTMMGTSELFELIRAGIDVRFLDLFSSSQISPDQQLAFREFLFLASGPELDRLTRQVEQGPSASLNADQAAELLQTGPQRFDLSSQAAEKMYESFRRRHLAALARRLRADSGACRTAEEYIMIHLLTQTDLPSLLEENPAK